MNTDFFEVRETRRRQSDTLGAFAPALVQAQKTVLNPAKKTDNPFFRSKYADLAACADACRGPLTANGIAVMAFPSLEGNIVSVETLLLHESGEWMSCTLSAEARKGKRDEGALPDNGAQSVTAAVTYLRRTGLTSLVFITPEDEDDDGNRAEGREAKKPTSEAERMSGAFRQIGVSISTLEAKLKHPIDQTTAEEFDELRGVYEQIKSGRPASEFFQAAGATLVASTTESRVLPSPGSGNREMEPPKPVEAPPVNHEPATPGNEPRPGEKRGRGRPPKAKTDPAKEEPAPEPTVPASASAPAAVAPTSPKAAPASSPLTDEQKKSIWPRLREFRDALEDGDALKAFVIRESGESDTASLSADQWKPILAKLEAAHAAGALKDLVAN